MSVKGTRPYAYGVVALTLGAILSPVLRSEPVDGYPLSTYPMFAFRERRNVLLAQALGVRGDGQRVVLSPRVFGTDEVLQAETKLLRAARDGGAVADDLCADLLSRAQAGDRHADFEQVVIRTLTVDTVDYFARGEAAIHPGDDVVTCGGSANAR